MTENINLILAKWGQANGTDNLCQTWDLRILFQAFLVSLDSILVCGARVPFNTGSKNSLDAMLTMLSNTSCSKDEILNLMAALVTCGAAKGRNPTFQPFFSPDYCNFLFQDHAFSLNKENKISKSDSQPAPRPLTSTTKQRQF